MINTVKLYISKSNNLIWILLEKVLKIVYAIFISGAIAKNFGPELFGRLGYGQSFMFVFSFLATLGLESVLIKKIVVQNSSEQINLLFNAFLLKLIGCIISILLINLTSFFYNSIPLRFVIVLLSIDLIIQSFTIIEYYFQALKLNLVIFKINIYFLIISSILKIAILYFHFSFNIYLYSLIFDSFILASLFVFKLTNISEFKFSALRINKKYMFMLLNLSLPVMLSTLAITIYMRFDQILIEKYFGLTSVGNYSAALKLSEAWYFIPAAFSNFLFPIIILNKENNIEKFKTILSTSFFTLFWSAFVICLIISLSSTFFVNIIFGNKYYYSAQILSIHVWSGLFISLGYLVSRILILENLQVYMLYNTLIGCIISLLLNFYFLPIYGMHSSAVTSVITQFFASFFCLLFFPKTRIWFFFIIRSITSFKTINGIHKIITNDNG
jgi:O-antigen/teichoic acid export membrane protein